MKMLLASALMLVSSPAFATDLCSRYNHKPEYQAAIKTVSARYQVSYENMCSNAAILDIEAQPSHTVTYEGDVIPHVQLQLHFATHSCLYMVRISDNSITSFRCYSGM